MQRVNKLVSNENYLTVIYLYLLEELHFDLNGKLKSEDKPVYTYKMELDLLYTKGMYYTEEFFDYIAERCKKLMQEECFGEFLKANEKKLDDYFGFVETLKSTELWMPEEPSRLAKSLVQSLLTIDLGNNSTEKTMPSSNHELMAIAKLQAHFEEYIPMQRNIRKMHALMHHNK